MCYVKQSHIPLYLRAARQETDLIFPICSGLRYAPVQIVLFVKYGFMLEAVLSHQSEKMRINKMR